MDSIEATVRLGVALHNLRLTAPHHGCNGCGHMWHGTSPAPCPNCGSAEPTAHPPYSSMWDRLHVTMTPFARWYMDTGLVISPDPMEAT